MYFEKKLGYSTARIILFVITILIFIVQASFLFFTDYYQLIILGLFIYIMIFFVILEIPLKIIVTDESIAMDCVKGLTTIYFNEIKSIEMQEIRGIQLWKSNFLGYSGIFYNFDIGIIHVKLRKFSQAFLIQTKSGKNYAFGCEDAATVVRYVKSKIQ
ncbi:MAG: hypothetical protein IKQ46_08780 [Bacteroidales bacterium]|nr:hypothetical protein [Bacteroidales bacterium]